MSTYFAPTKFLWRLGGNQVHLCGSFTRWVETVPMVPEEGQPGVFSVVVHLPPGYHQYKFIVDGEWRHDEAQPFMPDPLGNVNNWLFVRKPESQDEDQGVPHLPVDSAQDISNRMPAEVHQAETSLNFRPPQMGGALMASLAGNQDKEPLFTKSKIKEFLSHHTASELIPESGKVVLLDIDLPLRQALHALHEQGAASAPLFDPVDACISGILSASDFITTLQHLKNLALESSNPMSEAEMDQHTIRGLREELSRQGDPPKALVSVKPEDSLQHVVDVLLSNHCSMAPVVTTKETSNSIGYEVRDVLHNATLGGVLACLLRHFRSSLALLPLLAQPLESLPLGTWSLDSNVAILREGKDSVSRNISSLATVNPSTLLTEAFSILLDGGFSCLPVVDDDGMLVDIYARADITSLAKSNAYSRLQFEDVTVGQALALAAQPNPPSLLSGPGNKQQAWAGTSPSASQNSMNDVTSVPAKHRVHACTNKDPLRAVMERLSIPGVRRLLIVNPESKKLEGIVSLSDVARFLMT